MREFTTIRGFVEGDEPEGIEPEMKHRVTLRISSSRRLEFEELESILGVAPTTTVRRGERLTPRGPVSRADVWLHEVAVDERLGMEVHMDAAYRLLAPSIEYLSELRRSAEVRILLSYASNVDHGGLTIHGPSLELFTSLGINLELYVTVVA